MTTDNGQKAICEECGIANKSVLRCAQTTAPECACMQMALVSAAQHAGEVQSVVPILSGYEDRINNVITKLMKPDIK
jgi:hypothetical protein